MILANGTYGHIGNGIGRPRRAATGEQIRQARQWASANVAGHDTGELRRALARMQKHPEAYSEGYSQARTARTRIEAELATRTDA